MAATSVVNIDPTQRRSQGAEVETQLLHIASTHHHLNPAWQLGGFPYRHAHAAAFPAASTTTGCGGNRVGGMSRTPTPVRQLADPLAWQVLPSRRQRRVRPRPNTGTSLASHATAASSATRRTVDRSVMGPPPSKRRRQVVLEEEEYEEAMKAIIQRDFFPDNKTLAQQVALLDAVNSGDPGRIASVRRRIVSEMRRGTPTPGATPLVSDTPRSSLGGSSALGDDGVDGDFGAGSATPAVHGGVGDGGDAASVAASAITAGSAVGGSRRRIGLDEFHAQATSEDNASFARNVAKQEKELRAKRWWVYESADSAAGAAKHLALTAGQEPKLLADIIAKGTDPHGELQSWKHRGKNQLMWQPELGVSADTSKVSDAGRSLLLRNQSEEQAEIDARAPKAIRHRGTRFQATFAQQQAQLALNKAIAAQAAAQEGALGGVGAGHDADAAPAAAAARTPGGGAYGYLATPLLEPGQGVAASPLMTWGNVEGTPLVLGPTATPVPAGGAGGASAFRIAEEPMRDRLAQKLEARSRRKRRDREAAGATPLTPLLRGRRRRATTPRPRTPAERRAAAVANARRLTARRRPGSAVQAGSGGDAQLRASYSGRCTPLRARSGSRSARRGAAAGRTPARGAVGKRGSSSSSSGITDGLLAPP